MLLRLFCIHLLTMALLGCNQQQRTEVTILAKYNDQNFSCEAFALNTLMFYLSLNVNSKQQFVENQYSSKNAVLLGSDCEGFNNWHFQLEPSYNSGDSLSFTLGLPLALNHGNPLTAQAPLNVSEMFWSWQLGHKFLRLDSQQLVTFHLGSTGCHSASRLRAPNSRCKNPNLFNFEIDNFDVNKPIIFSLDRLLANAAKGQKCMSEHNNELCLTLFRNLQNSALFYQED